MEKQYEGVCYRPSPFLTTIISPQLKNKLLPLRVAQTTEDYLSQTTNYTIIDGYAASELDKFNQQQFSLFLEKCTTSVVLVTDHNFKVRSRYLDLGFTHILELPIATELVVKTIENTVKKFAGMQHASFTYQQEHYSPFTYLHDGNGSSYLVSGKKACYLTTAEKGILEYLQKRNGYATKQELAYAGWKHFEVKHNTITVAIKKIRRKLIENRLPYHIKSLYGYGYLLEAQRL
jgi:DNA-binding response OmpR family regulator